MLRVGEKVKIPDIGPLATVLRSEKGHVELDLGGEIFWMPVHLVRVIEEVA